MIAGCQGDTRQENATGNENRQPPSEQETPLKMIEFLIGEWELVNATGGQNTQQQENRRLEFTNEARYIVRAGGQKIDSGAYRMNEQLKNLYLESEANERPQEFEVDVQGDQMTLTPRDPASGQENVQYVYRRAGPASIPPDKTP